MSLFLTGMQKINGCTYKYATVSNAVNSSSQLFTCNNPNPRISIFEAGGFFFFWVLLFARKRFFTFLQCAEAFELPLVLKKSVSLLLCTYTLGLKPSLLYLDLSTINFIYLKKFILSGQLFTCARHAQWQNPAIGLKNHLRSHLLLYPQTGPYVTYLLECILERIAFKVQILYVCLIRLVDLIAVFCVN